MTDSKLYDQQFHAMCVNGKWNCSIVVMQQERPVGVVPEILAKEAYKEYAEQYGTSQSFDRLHERGGFGSVELMSLLFDRIKRLEFEAEESK